MTSSWARLCFVHNFDNHDTPKRLLFLCRPCKSSAVLDWLCIASQAANSVDDATRPGIHEAVRQLCFYITSIIMMLTTILLMIEDRCNISFANNACYVHISFLICDENACKTNSVIYFKCKGTFREGLMSTNAFMEGITFIFTDGIMEPRITFAFMWASTCAFNTMEYLYIYGRDYLHIWGGN